VKRAPLGTRWLGALALTALHAGPVAYLAWHIAGR
jgi:hypothetical protein